MRAAADTALDAIADRIGDHGWAVTPGFIAREAVETLRSVVLERAARGEFRPAAVGAGPRRAVRADIRGDRICWVHAPESPAEERLLQEFDALRLALNRVLQLGLFEFECHYALYPAGAGYARHIDQLIAGAARRVSIVLYLNADWNRADGGALRLYRDAAEPVEILPRGGTLVTFLSERFEHEVLPTQRERLSLTGWLRCRPAAATGYGDIHT
jgi:SM-20-related protein